MSHYANFYLGNGLLLNVIAPLDYGPDPAVPVVLDAASSKIAHLFDKDVKSQATVAGSGLTVTLESVKDLAVSDIITIEEDDGLFTRHPVTVIDTATKLVTFTTGLGGGFEAGARVWKTYGSSSVTGTAYGTPAVTTTDWGYVFEFTYDYDMKLRRNQRLEAMVVLKKASTGANYTRTWDVMVAEPYGTP